MATVSVAAVGGYSYVASGTRPFSTGADVVTVIVFGVGVVLLARALVRRHRRTAVGENKRLVFWPWGLALAVLFCWELATYFAGFSGARHAYPTLSSLTDIAFRHREAKAGVFALWVALGWGLVRR